MSEEVEIASEGLPRNGALREEKGMAVRSGDGMRFQREKEQRQSTEDCDKTRTEAHTNGADALDEIS